MIPSLGLPRNRLVSTEPRLLVRRCVDESILAIFTCHEDTLRTESRSRAGSAVSADAARLAAFAEQQLRAQNQFTQDARSEFRVSILHCTPEFAYVDSSNSRLGQNSRGKPAQAPYVPTIGRQGAGTGQSLFSRFPLNEPDET
jgi:hypothetical protein